MKKVGTYTKVTFDSVEELRDYVKDFVGDAFFWNDWLGEVYPIQYDDEKDVAVIGSDAWEDVEDAHLDSIYAYSKID